ncbi:phosphoribosylaminoimidazolesuccinocarboxamide synthase [Lacticaseibacillus hulanensis]|jgi:phosphoribosylaminoimidazole-succinocarboxamide synthase|uniref:phosphoribosylaminoimidazolesuccinocarboxamide synthase n=1 Tax=Lacticaseibacillus hulanensis TaxID=2493111 RepID=UPI000FD9CC56|nr:phosphoribosylaminoimidazolesuccinocarboxamide synthase [Lacticaseibacillus hulanensis]
MTVKKEVLFEGKAKRVSATDDPELLWVEYLDQATALNGKRKETIAGKGTLNLQISALLFQEITAAGVPTHYVDTPDQGSMIVRKAKMLPLEVVLRNYASGHFETKFHVKHLLSFKPAIHEYYYKSDALDDPFINNDQIQALGIADAATLAKVRALTDQVNDFLTARFAKAGIKLVDFKLEFGTLADGSLVLADELSPDNFRLVDDATGDSLDKDVFRKHAGELQPVYREVLRRLQASK